MKFIYTYRGFVDFGILGQKWTPKAHIYKPLHFKKNPWIFVDCVDSPRTKPKNTQKAPKNPILKGNFLAIPI